MSSGSARSHPRGVRPGLPVRRVRCGRLRAGTGLRSITRVAGSSRRRTRRPGLRSGWWRSSTPTRRRGPRRHGKGRRPGSAGAAPAAGRVAVHPRGVHRPDGHPVRQPGRAAGVLTAAHPESRRRASASLAPRPGGGGVSSGRGSFAHLGVHVEHRLDGRRATPTRIPRRS